MSGYVLRGQPMGPYTEPESDSSTPKPMPPPHHMITTPVNKGGLQIILLQMKTHKKRRRAKKGLKSPAATPTPPHSSGDGQTGRQVSELLLTISPQKLFTASHTFCCFLGYGLRRRRRGQDRRHLHAGGLFRRGKDGNTSECTFADNFLKD